MNLAKSICKFYGCGELLDAPGYCPAHKKTPQERAAAAQAKFVSLEIKKTPEQKKFYSSKAWTATSKEHRIREPLCRKCRAAGLVVPGTLVHHNPAREFLVANGLNPHDDKFLETLCFSCHQRELREKQKNRPPL